MPQLQAVSGRNGVWMMPDWVCARHAFVFAHAAKFKCGFSISGRVIYRESGCNHMTCFMHAGGCGFEFCWICLAPYHNHR